MNRVFEPERFRVDVDQFQRMGEAGIFPPDAHLELIDGELLTMAPIGSRHVYAVDTLTRLALQAPVSNLVHVSTQSPVVLSRFNEPQPDLLLLRPPGEAYLHRTPTTADVLLLVEIADTTLQFDRTRKVPLYARCGVGEVWLVDIVGRRLELYAEPTPMGYRSMRTLNPGDLVAPARVPEMQHDWALALGPER